MGKTGYIVSGVIISAAVFSAGAAAAYFYVNDNTKSVEENNISELNIQTDIEEETAQTTVSDGLSETAVFSYEIYNVNTDTTDIILGSCPFELMGKSMSDVKEYYPDWQVTAFSSDEVVLQKNVGGKYDERYVVGVYNDYVTVFYENSEEGIYMVTDIPVAGLESDKQSMLNDGIYVEGKE
ncbi:MAG: hypothetical protein LUE88_02485, partial [Clostridiales bacterium]|nr:hypothetical protein [Clostridiales bacterium]